MRARQNWLPWKWPVTSLIYRLYERYLLRQVRALPVPRHIGLILDGNRRYARHNNLSDPHDIYMAGANKLDELLDWCTELQIQSMTLWVFSTENLKRPPEQVAAILSAVERKLELLVNGKLIFSRRIRVRTVGRLELLPASTIATLRAAEAATRYHTGMCLTIAAAYGGREEIVDAVQRLLGEHLSEGICDALDRLTQCPNSRSHRELITFVPDRPGHDFRYAMDFAKLKKELGWSPKHSFEEALFSTVKWYVENRASWEPLLIAHKAGVRRGLA